MNNHEALARYCTLTELNKGGKPVRNASYWKRQADKLELEIIGQNKMIESLMNEIATISDYVEELEKERPILMLLQDYNDIKLAIAARAIEIIANPCLSKCGAITQLKKELL